MDVGVISYLNALPLTHGLPWKLEHQPPAALQTALLAGRFDLALCSVTTALCHDGFFIVPATAIGCRGVVNSVRLVFHDDHADVERCRAIALDPESNAANLLLRTLLHRYFSSAADIALVAHDHPSDAHLIIGDRALHIDSARPSLDLGAIWSAWTGLPFVFAAWLVRTPTVAKTLVQQLTAICEKNLSRLGTLVEQFVPGGIAAERLTYLRRHISYALGLTEIAGLQRFQDELMACHLAPRRTLPFAAITDGGT